MPNTSPRTNRAIVYVDGFNLFYGVRAAYGRRYLWLDLEALARSMLNPGQHLVLVRYFTAHVRNDPAGGSRQADYLEALTSSPLVEITLGRYQEKQLSCHRCNHAWTSYEEKETDVSIAANMVRDAARHSLDTALVVSADSDLLPAMHIAKEMQPTMAIVAAFPPRRRSDEIRKFATATFTISEQKLKAGQLPETVQGKKRVVSKPTHWQ